MSTITLEDLRKVKGLGPSKAKVIEQHIDEVGLDNVSAKSLTSIKGVSNALANRVMNVVRGNTQEEATSKPTTTKRASAKKAPTTNGHSGHHTAGEIRRFAREAESFGYPQVAEELRTRVSALLDDELATP